MNMSKKHILIMLACCLVPLAALAAILVFKIPVTSVIFFGIILLCPVLHLLMMGNMMGHPAERGASSDHMGHSQTGRDWRSPAAKARLPQLPAGEKKD